MLSAEQLLLDRLLTSPEVGLFSLNSSRTSSLPPRLHQREGRYWFAGDTWFLGKIQGDKMPRQKSQSQRIPVISNNEVRVSLALPNTVWQPRESRFTAWASRFHGDQFSFADFPLEML